MRLLPRWVWKRIPHRHLDRVTRGFWIKWFDEAKSYECVRCGRRWDDARMAEIMTQLRKADEATMLNMIVKGVNPDWEYRDSGEH